MKYALTLGLFFVLAGNLSTGQTLGDYLDRGLKNSPFLQDYNNQLRSIAIDSLKVLAGFKPQVGVSADLMYPPAFGKFAYDSALSDGGHYTALVRVNQPLFSRKIAAVQMQSVLIQKLTTENSIKITESDLQEAITAQYISAYADYSQVQFERGILKTLRDQQATLKLMVENGMYQQTDYLNLTVSISSRSINGKQVYRQYKNSLAILNLLCGIHDTSSVDLKKPDLFIRNSFDIGTSPNWVRFRLDSLKIINEHQLVDLNYRPRLGAFADAGISAISPRRIPYNLGTSVGLSFTMPLYDGKQRQLEHKKISFAEHSRTRYRSFFENRYQQQRDQLLEQLKLTEDLYSDQEDQLSGLEKLISVYKVEINTGLVRWLDFITVINNYAQAGNDLTQSEISRLQIINQLNYLK